MAYSRRPGTPDELLRHAADIERATHRLALFLEAPDDRVREHPGPALVAALSMIPERQPLRRGKDQAVIDFLEREAPVDAMYSTLCRFFEEWIPAFEADNRSYLTVAIGCTGGQHRSVYLSERLAQHFRQRYPNVATRHRELS